MRQAAWMRALMAGVTLSLAAAPVFAAGTMGVSKAKTETGICHVDKVTFLVGQVLTDALRQEALLKSGAKKLRIVPPGVNITADFDPERLTIYVDKDKVVMRVVCK